ncbi:MAG: GH3 auxin-responsive promoter family protein, partial [Acetobacteraceae bacterium]|nr:GH3 auxin-responsive promoter family protein [Acetobacteraceae bacterium]
MIDATSVLRVYSRYRARVLAAQHPVRIQERQLLRLVRRAAQTRFGRAHGFASIQSVADFQARVPLRRYEDFWRDFWKPAFPQVAGVSWPGRIPFFAVSSGTSSGTTKYIPVSPAMTRSNKRAALDVLVHHLAARPRSRVLDGAQFMLGGSTDLKPEAPGIRSGDLSGIAAAGVLFWARAWFFPPPQLALIADWEKKIDILGRESLIRRIRSISGTPSWLLLFFEKLASLKPNAPPRLAEYYPFLELLIHGGVDFAPYRPRFESWLDGSKAELREVYPASEGFIAVADRTAGEGLRMILDHGIFHEFVPIQELDSARPVRHWIRTAETGVDYALILSTCAGLWSYVLGDVVRLIERTPPRLLVTGRTSYFLSAYGEHLTGNEIERSVIEAAGAIGRGVT